MQPFNQQVNKNKARFAPRASGRRGRVRGGPPDASTSTIPPQQPTPEYSISPSVRIDHSEPQRGASAYQTPGRTQSQTIGVDRPPTADIRSPQLGTPKTNVEPARLGTTPTVASPILRSPSTFAEDLQVPHRVPVHVGSRSTRQRAHDQEPPAKVRRLASVEVESEEVQEDRNAATTAPSISEPNITIELPRGFRMPVSRHSSTSLDDSSDEDVEAILLPNRTVAKTVTQIPEPPQLPPPTAPSRRVSPPQAVVAIPEPIPVAESSSSVSRRISPVFTVPTVVERAPIAQSSSRPQSSHTGVSPAVPLQADSPQTAPAEVPPRERSSSQRRSPLEAVRRLIASSHSPSPSPDVIHYSGYTAMQRDALADSRADSIAASSTRAKVKKPLTKNTATPRNTRSHAKKSLAAIPDDLIMQIEEADDEAAANIGIIAEVDDLDDLDEPVALLELPGQELTVDAADADVEMALDDALPEGLPAMGSYEHVPKGGRKQIKSRAGLFDLRTAPSDRNEWPLYTFCYAASAQNGETSAFSLRVKEAEEERKKAEVAIHEQRLKLHQMKRRVAFEDQIGVSHDPEVVGVVDKADRLGPREGSPKRFRRGGGRELEFDPQDDPDEVVIPDGENVAPQVKMVNGEIVIDEESKMVSGLHTDGEISHQAANAIIEDDENKELKYEVSTRYGKKRYISKKRWSTEEMKIFYLGLEWFGMGDFLAISRMLPQRSRGQVLGKFKSEDKKDPDKVTKAVRAKRPIDKAKYAYLAGFKLSDLNKDPNIMVQEEVEKLERRQNGTYIPPGMADDTGSATHSAPALDVSEAEAELADILGGPDDYQMEADAVSLGGTPGVPELEVALEEIDEFHDVLREDDLPDRHDAIADMKPNKDDESVGEELLV